MSEQNYMATARARAYLLGEMDDAARFAFERDLLADAEFYETYLAAQDELIESYLYDELAPDQRARFASHFLVTDEHRARLQLLRDLDERAQSFSAVAANPLPDEGVLTPTQSNVVGALGSWWRTRFGTARPRFAFVLPVAVTALLLLTVLFSWRLLLNRQNTRDEQARSTRPAAEAQAHSTTPYTNTSPSTAETSSPANAEQVATTNQPHPPPARPSETHKPALPPRHSAPVVSYALTLSPISLRDADSGTHALRLPPTASGTLRLRLILDDSSITARTLRAQVKTAEGSAVSVFDNLSVRRQQSAAFVALKLATGKLTNGDYTIRLTNSTTDGEAMPVARYSFSVIRR